MTSVAGMRRVDQRLDRREAEPEQNARQHRVGERGGNRRDRAAERPDQPRRDDQDADDEKRPDRRRETRPSPRRWPRAAPRRASTRPPRSACATTGSARCRQAPSRSKAPSSPTPPARRSRPTAVRPFRMTAKELAKPTKAVATPAAMGARSEDLVMRWAGCSGEARIGRTRA